MHIKNYDISFYLIFIDFLQRSSVIICEQHAIFRATSSKTFTKCWCLIWQAAGHAAESDGALQVAFWPKKVLAI
jgi:hypothetical protein